MANSNASLDIKKAISTLLGHALPAQHTPSTLLEHTSTFARLKSHRLISAMVQGRPTLIYPASLSCEDPSALKQLKALAKLGQFCLLQDRRKKALPCIHDRRRLCLPAFALATSLMVPLAFSDPSESAKSQYNTEHAHLHMFDSQSKTELTKGKLNLLDSTDINKSNINDIKSISEQPRLKKYIARILNQHLIRSDSDPKHLREDIQQIAAYFSQHPAATKLLKSIEDANWTLQYKPAMFQTVVEGNRFEVRSAKVYFDPRAAAKLKFHNKCKDKLPFCVASPADALLHELLHIQSALLRPEIFLAEGGLNGVIYPYQHEQRIIQKENVLYGEMTKHDGTNRPIRKAHVGRYQMAQCVTCLQ